MSERTALSLFPELQEDILRLQRSGVLPSQQLESMIASDLITADEAFQESQVQPASLDLRLGEVAHQVRASFLPGSGATVAAGINLLEVGKLDLADSAILQKGCVYIVPLLEHLALPRDIIGKANPKSSTGRLDVFARLITDYGEQFDRVGKGYRGQLYLEISPRSFSIRVKKGTKLNQIRLLKGLPAQSDSKLQRLHKRESLVYRNGEPRKAQVANGLWLTVDLSEPTFDGVIGWQAAPNAPVVDIDATHELDPMDYWQPVPLPSKPQMILNPGEFYLLCSKERVRIPAEMAAEMVPYDPTVGEFRVHYAGFFDPGFGYSRGDLHGTRAVLEVRSHETPFLLRDGQHIGRLVFESLLEPSSKVYGTAVGSSYQNQAIALGRQFRVPRSEA